MGWFEQAGIIGLLLLVGGVALGMTTWARAFRRDQIQRGETPTRDGGVTVAPKPPAATEIELTLAPVSLRRAWADFRTHGGHVTGNEINIPVTAVPAALTVAHILDWSGRRNEARPILEAIGQHIGAVPRIYLDAVELHLRKVEGTAQVLADQPDLHEPCLRTLRGSTQDR